ncbi:Peptidase M20 domain-containing protein 2 AltName: Full=Aminoacylase-1-like protein 2 [Serendipita indica DSM 11827]|nr:Peptidase M20 domain-containing protein 2 AltName: Full=Aminoacylase-1-like protein 2 [Serendipita indica DSM 11827]
MHNMVPCYHTETVAQQEPLWLLDDARKDDKPPPYLLATHEKGFKRPWLDEKIIATINERIEELDPALRELSLKIHDHPEIMWTEHYAHDTLTAFMDSYGFNVTKHYLGLETAWRADFEHRSSAVSKKSPLKTLGLNSEMDALPGIGHACGHNLIAIAGVAVALAVKTALEKHDLDGRIVLLGTPAEEGGAGKIDFIQRGGYKDMDICLMCHPGPGPRNTTGTGPSLAITGIEVEYFGHTAHASAAPWEGQNALDAAFLAYSSVSVLRQQIKPTHRVHGIVEGRDWAPNIIPDYAKMRWLVRAPSAAEVDILRERVINCFKGAALSTGCKMELKVDRTMFDLRQNSVLSSEYHNVSQSQYGVGPNSMEGAIGGSTDFGNVTYELPSLHPSFSIPTEPNGGNHTIGFTRAARTEKAHECTLKVAKALTQVGMRAIIDEEFLSQVKEAFNPNR